jgi:hypothetical protein
MVIFLPYLSGQRTLCSWAPQAPAPNDRIVRLLRFAELDLGEFPDSEYCGAADGRLRTSV